VVVVGFSSVFEPEAPGPPKKNINSHNESVFFYPKICLCYFLLWLNVLGIGEMILVLYFEEVVLDRKVRFWFILWNW